ncbi:hypothetical protein GCM10020331_028580 [Ectobacillus funiculus]
MIKAGSAALAPRILPTSNFVNGISSTINIMKGIERNMFTNNPITVLTALFSHILPLLVKKTKVILMLVLE